MTFISTFHLRKRRDPQIAKTTTGCKQRSFQTIIQQSTRYAKLGLRCRYWMVW